MTKLRYSAGLLAIALAAVSTVATGAVLKSAPQKLAFQGTKPMPEPPGGGGGLAFQGTKPMPEPPGGGGGLAFQGTKPMPEPPGGGGGI
jgi:hypothetical protein